MSDVRGPLTGMRIIDLSTVVFGPYATQIFGDLGADVIKIESGSGDTMRNAGRSHSKGMGALYLCLNRNKRSVRLNLKDEAAKKVMRELLSSADAFFHNVRAESVARLGFDYDSVKAIKPDIVYVHCVGFASDGPYGGRPAYDDLIQAGSGISDLIPIRAGGGAPAYMPTLVGDKTAGLHAAYATLAGLLHKERTGEGQFIEVPMLETVTSYNMVENLYGHTFVPPLGNMTYTRSINPNRKPYPTLDGYICIVPYSTDEWAKFFELGGRPEVFDDPKFKEYNSRTEHIGELYALVEEVAKTKTTAQWLELLQAANIPCTRANRMTEVLEDEHLVATGFFEKRHHPTEGDYLAMQHPVKFEKSPAEIRRDPPLLGADTAEVLRELGYDDDAIAGFTG